MPPVTRSRIGAILVAVSLVLHLAVLTQLTWPWALFMLVLVAVCAPCAITLWQRESAPAWTMVAATSATMLLAHLVWGSSMHATSSADHGAHGGHGAHTGQSTGVAASTDSLMTVLLVVAAAELVLALFALVVRRKPTVSVSQASG